MIGIRHAFFAAAVIGLALAMSGQQAFAHLMLQKSEPAQGATITAAPTQVRLWFTENVDLAVSLVQIAGPSGKLEIAKLQSTEAKLLTAPITGPMADGGYKISWQTAGSDGHVEKGVVSFTLKRAR